MFFTLEPGAWRGLVRTLRSGRLQIAPVESAMFGGHAGVKPEPIELDALLADVERELLRRALHQAKGNKTKAAALLNITRARLHRRMEQLNVE